MIEVTMYDVNAEQAFDCIRQHAGAIRSLTSNPDTGEWVAVVDVKLFGSGVNHWLRTNESIADHILSQVAALGYVAGHQGELSKDVTGVEARDAAIRFISTPYTARYHMIDQLGIDVEVDRNNNTHQQTMIWLERVLPAMPWMSRSAAADKVAELIEALNKESR